MSNNRSMPKFSASRAEFDVIHQIAARYQGKFPGRRKIMDVMMDVEAVHSNGCPLRLEALLAADDFNFIHDVGGIVANLDRNTGALGNCFTPRFTLPANATVGA